MLTDDLLNGAEAAAAYLGVKRAALYHMVAQGHLPVARKGRRLFFRKSELDAAFRATGV